MQTEESVFISTEINSEQLLSYDAICPVLFDNSSPLGLTALMMFLLHLNYGTNIDFCLLNVKQL